MKDDLISRHGVSVWLDNMGHSKLADVVMNKDRFPSAQQDEEKMSDLLYDVYRLACPQLGTGGVAVLKSYISMIYKEIFGEEGPGWMR